MNKQEVPCSSCVAGSGKMAGHKGRHITFVLPDDWQVDKTKRHKSYINPDGDKQFNSMAAVERFVNGEQALTYDWSTTASSSSSSSSTSTTTAAAPIPLTSSAAITSSSSSSITAAAVKPPPAIIPAAVMVPVVPVATSSSTTTRKRSSKDEGREHLKPGSIVMVLYGESQWAKAKIHQHVSTGIKIQWVEDGAATQLIETEEVDVRIRAMNGEDKEEYPVRVVVPRSGKSNKVSKDFVIPSNKASKDFVIPSDWRTISTKRRSGPWLNHKLKDKKYVSPDNKSFRSLVAVERYLTGTNTVQEWSQYLMSSSSSSSSSEEEDEDDDDEVDEADNDVTSAPSSSLSSVTNGVPRRIYKLGDCRKCAAGSGKRDGHKGKHAFKLPQGWTTEIRTGNGPTDDGGKYKHYISPEGEVFSSVPAVERYLESISTSGGGAISGNGSPSSSQSSTSSMINNTVALPIRKEGECKKCMAGSGNLNGHRGLHKLNKEQMQQQIKRKKQQEKQQKKEQLRKEQERQEDIEQKRLQRNQRISARDSPTSFSSSSSSTVTSHLHSGNTVMVSYGEVGSIQWAKATILHQVNTGIKIQWIDGGATQLINHIDVNNRIREMTEDDMQERDEDDGEDGYEVENQEKDAEDHKDSPVAFQLPSGWSVQKKKGWKSYINPDGDKRFNSMAAVERHINGEPSKLTTSSSSSSSTPSSETTSNAIHQIIEHFKTCTHSNSNSNPICCVRFEKKGAIS